MIEPGPKGEGTYDCQSVEVAVRPCWVVDERRRGLCSDGDERSPPFSLFFAFYYCFLGKLCARWLVAYVV